MAASIINSEPAQADVVFLSANNDISSSFGKGADAAPAAIRRCLESQIELREMRTGVSAAERLKIGWLDPGDLNGKRDADALAAAVATVAERCGEILKAGKFPFVIGGDHSNAIGALIALGMRHDPSDVTILHIDAHHDLRLDDADYNDAPYGRFAHCSALRPAADAGFRLVQVGIRAFSREEEEYARRKKRVKAFYWGRTTGFRPPTIAEVMKAVRTEKVYVTLDVDGIDPAFMPATGTPVSGGLHWWYVWDLLQAVCQSRKVLGADLMEVAPRPGDSLTEYNAAQLAYNIVTWAWAR
ncbi:MAG TPA: arginase family protein [Candidatus Eisenbacteria bacterium]|nr:arginase family protein [Candidatus Eisenbacteria bacterium]